MDRPVELLEVMQARRRQAEVLCERFTNAYDAGRWQEAVDAREELHVLAFHALPVAAPFTMARSIECEVHGMAQALARFAGLAEFYAERAERQAAERDCAVRT